MDKPIGLLIIALLVVIHGILGLYVMISSSPTGKYSITSLASMTVYGLAHLLSAVGLFAQKKWGLSLTRTLAMAFFIFSLVFERSVIGIVIYGLFFWSLFRKEVTSAFWE